VIAGGVRYIIHRRLWETVTREAVVQGYERFVSDAIERTVKQFSLTRALQNGVEAPGGGVVDKLLKNSGRVRRKVVQPELEMYRDRAFEQFDVLLEYVESDEEIEAYREDLVAVGAFENELREDLPDERREEVLGFMLGRYERFGEALVPLLDSPETEFWDAAAATLTADEARELVEEHFRYTKPLREYPDAFRLVAMINGTDVFGPFGLLAGSIKVVYTEEAIRATAVAEDAVIQNAKRDIDERFDG
jgi:hypothetical protein